MSKKVHEMTVTMLPPDIDRGVREDCEFCPLALAVTRSAKAHGFDMEGSQADVNGSAAFIRDRLPTGGRIYLVSSMPRQCAVFVASFDNGETVSLLAPFTLRFVQWDPMEDDSGSYNLGESMATL